MSFRILFIIFIICLSFSNSYAGDFDYPNANDFSYPEYEVKMVKDMLGGLEDTKTSNELGVPDEAIARYIIESKFDVSNYRNKLFIAFVFISFSKETVGLEYLSSNPAVIEHIKKYEEATDYSNQNMWDKLITWTLLRGEIKEKLENKIKFKERRIKLLNNIIENNPQFAPLAYYLLTTETDFLWLKPTSEQFKTAIDALKSMIDKYPNTEFACASSLLMASLYRDFTAEYEKTAAICDSIIKNNKNFYTGIGDLYSSVYEVLVRMYKKNGDNEKAKYFFDRINKNVSNYKSLQHVMEK